MWWRKKGASEALPVEAAQPGAVNSARALFASNAMPARSGDNVEDQLGPGRSQLEPEDGRKPGPGLNLLRLLEGARTLVHKLRRDRRGVESRPRIDAAVRPPASDAAPAVAPVRPAELDARDVPWRRVDDPGPGSKPLVPRRRWYGEGTSNVAGVHTDAELRALLAAAGDRPVVVDYGARWCDHCKHMAPAFIQMADEFPSAIFVLADVDKLVDMAADIRYTPTFAFYARGRKVDQVAGSNAQQLRDHLWLQVGGSAVDLPPRP